MYDDTEAEAFRVRRQALDEQPANVPRADQRAQAVIERRLPAEQVRRSIAGPLRPPGERRSSRG